MRESECQVSMDSITSRCSPPLLCLSICSHWLLSLFSLLLLLGFLFTALKASDFTNIGAANNLAESLRLNGDLQLAVKLLEHTMTRTNQSDLSGLLEHALGGIHEESRDFTQAGKWYLTAALLQPQNAQYWLSASTLSFQAGDGEGEGGGGGEVDWQVAENVLARGLSEIPLQPDLLFHLGK